MWTPKDPLPSSNSYHSYPTELWLPRFPPPDPRPPSHRKQLATLPYWVTLMLVILFYDQIFFLNKKNIFTHHL